MTGRGLRAEQRASQVLEARRRRILEGEVTHLVVDRDRLHRCELTDGHTVGCPVETAGPVRRWCTNPAEGPGRSERTGR